jgi:hypothetical protein
LCHYKELTCENGREELGRRDERTHATKLLKLSPRISWLLMTIPFGLVCGTSITAGGARRQSLF